MEWSNSVTQSVTRCKATQTHLLILLEPPPNAPTKLQTLTTTALHKHLFTAPQVHRLLKTAAVTPLRLIADPADQDFVAFTAFFTYTSTPEMLLVDWNGRVVWRGTGFVSPRSFVGEIADVCGVDVAAWFGEPQRSAVLVVPGRTKTDRATTTSNNTTTTATTFTPAPVSKASPKPSSIAPTPKKSLTLQPAKCTLRARLPSGATICTQQTPETKFHKIRAWLSDELSVPGDRLTISTAFPRRVFDGGDEAKGLNELGLAPSANVLVAVGSETGRESGDRGDSGERGERGGMIGGGAVWGVVASVVAGARWGAGLVAGFVGSFLGYGVGAGDANGGRDAQQEESEREDERRGELDEDGLRYNGNGTQFGYDDDR